MKKASLHLTHTHTHTHNIKEIKNVNKVLAKEEPMLDQLTFHTWGADVAQFVQRQIGMLPTQVQFAGVTQNFPPSQLSVHSLKVSV